MSLLTEPFGPFGGTRMWASVVNRAGEVCASNTSTTDKTQVWPGSGAQGREDGAGLIFFGAGVPIYKAGKIIVGPGVSRDTSCADHEIAKRVRDLAGLNPREA